MERTANLSPLHPSPMPQVRTEVRAMGIQYVGGAVVVSESHKVAAEGAERDSHTRWNISRPCDGKPAVRDRWKRKAFGRFESVGSFSKHEEGPRLAMI